MTIHKQVDFKGTKVDEALLPLVQTLNDAGIETLYSCQGFEKDKDSTTGDAYIVLKDSEKANLFIKSVLALNYKLTLADNDIIKIPLFEVSMDFYNTYYRYTIYSRHKCTFRIFEKTLFEALKLTEDALRG